MELKKTSPVFDVLGTLTVEFIYNMTQHVEERKKVPLTLLLKHPDKTIEELVKFKSEEEAIKNQNIDGKHQEEARENILSTETNPETLSTSTFILYEKNKIKKAEAKLKKSEIFKLYQTSSNIDLDSLRELRKDREKNSEIQKGILLNKRQN
jgi:hypothetical protein